MYETLADFVVFIHLAYVGFVIFGELLVLAGALCRWQWVRNPVFRYSHLVAIAIVALEAVAGIACPLTVWENRLRELSGKPNPSETFIGGIIHEVLYFDLPEWVFTAMYVSFATAVLATMILIPPRRRASAVTG